MDKINLMKEKAAIKAVDLHVNSGMVIGLGTGSTASYAIKYISEKINNGILNNIKCLATSESTHKLAIDNGITIVDIDTVDDIDVAIDGADEIDKNLNLIKGGGGALLREKIVENKANKFIVIADETKLNRGDLGTRFPIPVEVVKFGHQTICREIASSIDCESWKLRENNNELYITNNGNYIVDIKLKKGLDVNLISDILNKIPGVVCHGLFINMTTECIICDKDLNIHILNRNNSYNYF